MMAWRKLFLCASYRPPENVQDVLLAARSLKNSKSQEEEVSEIGQKETDEKGSAPSVGALLKVINKASI